MALKDWKKVGKTLWINEKRKEKVTYGYIGKKTFFMSFDLRGYSNDISKMFDKRSQAKDYTIKYMRTH